jgi:hypothetical protein
MDKKNLMDINKIWIKKLIDINIKIPLCSILSIDSPIVGYLSEYEKKWRSNLFIECKGTAWRCEKRSITAYGS